MYTEHRPCTLLSPYIDKYWEFKGNPEQGTRINILPDGCTDFIFTLGDSPQTLNGNLTMRPFHTYFIGPMTGYSDARNPLPALRNIPLFGTASTRTHRSKALCRRYQHFLQRFMDTAIIRTTNHYKTNKLNRNQTYTSAIRI